MQRLVLVAILVGAFVSVCSDQHRIETHSDNEFAPVEYLVVERFHLQSKHANGLIPTPAKFAADRSPSSASHEARDTAAIDTSDGRGPEGDGEISVDIQVAQCADYEFCFVVAQAAPSSAACTSSSSRTCLSDAAAVLGGLARTIDEQHLRPLFVRVYLDDIASFAAMNQLYLRVFGASQPPSRSICLPPSLPPLPPPASVH